jgi:cytochrome c nitrite reductase small subunit
LLGLRGGTAGPILESVHVAGSIVTVLERCTGEIVRNHGGQARLVLLLAVVGVGGLAGTLGLFTFHYGEGTAYLSDDPAACTNCHVMQEQFDSWLQSSHRPVAVCNSCHLPQQVAHRWVSKADNGFFHSWAFTFRNHPEPIRIKNRNLRIVHDNCVGCHREMIEEILPDAHAGASTTCFHCHKDAGHAAWR